MLLALLHIVPEADMHAGFQVGDCLDDINAMRAAATGAFPLTTRIHGAKRS